MSSTTANRSGRMLRLLLSVLMAVMLVPAVCWAGPYLDSAHGNASYGVNRATIDSRYSEFAIGNCAHCHEAHASREGSEPQPADGPAAHALFTANFNAQRTQNFYLESDNFCFACHSDGVGQAVINQNYSTTFGGANSGTGPQSIIAAFNQTSYHNLNDIRVFLQDNPSYPNFGPNSNPCSGCHNAHLAKRNWDSGEPGFPLLSTVSKPNNPDRLWGESETMATYPGYEAPYAFVDSREPAGVGAPDGGNTPDYAGFCTSCHNPDNTIWSTTLNRELKRINWGDTGLGPNKHGELSRDGANFFREPYLTAAAVKINLVLSCLDCHEPHGSDNVMLLRSRVNGEALEGTLADTASLSFLCKRCHTDDLAAGSGTADSWEFVHHLAGEAPYVQASCGSCHQMLGQGEVAPIACDSCHGHGMTDATLGTLQSGRVTF